MESILKYTISISVTAASLMFIFRKGFFTPILKRIGFKKQIRAQNPKNIIIVENEKECVDAINVLKSKCAEFPALGFDCEWITSSTGQRSPVALLQLATYDGLCVLIRLCKFQQTQINSELKILMANKEIIKIGVASGDDANYLNKDYHFDVHGWLDLRHLASEYFINLYNQDTILRRIQTVFSKKQSPPLPISDGLAGLSYRLLDFRLSKDWRIRCSNWEAFELSTEQIQYSARDALIALDLFDVFYNYKSMDEIRKFIEVGYKARTHLIYKTSTTNNPNNKKLSRRGYCTLNQPLYQNCFLEAPDGEPLSTCSKRKAEWYVSQKLGVCVRDDPLTVRLLFEPSGRAKGEADQYYLQPQRNICVVCGAADSHLRKNVVPHEYRRHLPTLMKNHTCHDVLLLCVECHALSSRMDEELRRRLEIQCEAPISRGIDRKLLDVPGTKEIRSAGRALLSRKAGQIPKERKEQLEKIITNYFGVDVCTPDLINEAATLSRTVQNEEYEPHGLRVVQWYSYHDGLVELERLWRKNFLDTMKPKYLPTFWSVSHTASRLKEKAQQNRVTPEEMSFVGLG